jgi:Type I phosphodiesterase / nucleotide pyrophosphatase
MNTSRSLSVGVSALALLLAASSAVAQDSGKKHDSGTVQHVLLISIDGMHSLDFANCSKGISTINSGAPYCPALASLAKHGVNYLQAYTPRPSDSFPGLTALVTGANPRTSGMYYDVSYDRKLSPPYATTPYGIVGGPTLCPSVIGTQVGLDEEVDVDLTRINGGGGINTNYLPRDSTRGCSPVMPHNWIRTNTIFEVVRQNGGYTAWTDKHPSYEWTNGPSGTGVADFFGPEINSVAVPLVTVGYNVPSCHTLPDTTATDDWTVSFQNIQCYDKLHVQAIVNQINGKNHDGSRTAPVPTLFGANFQAVSVGQKLVEKSISTTGGYVDALGTPSPSLLSEIQFVDTSIGQFINQLKNQNLLDSTLIIITAKHGQSPIDPAALLRITGDNSSLASPSAVLSPAGVGPGLPVAQADEDDVSLLWLTDQTQTTADVATLAASRALWNGGFGGEVFAGNSLKLSFSDPTLDSRTPDIIVAPNVGVVYTGGTKKVSEHGGFSNDDRNVLLIVSNPSYSPSTYTGVVETRQVAPTILQALGYDPNQLEAVQREGTPVLPGLPFTGTK